MALARKCDRCKTLYEHYPDAMGSRSGTFNALRRVRGDSSGSLVYEESPKDLCPYCMDKLNKFLFMEDEL